MNTEVEVNDNEMFYNMLFNILFGKLFLLPQCLQLYQLLTYLQ